MQLWRGLPFQGLDLPSVAPEAARLVELRLRGLEDRVEAELRAGRVPEVGEVRELTAEHPYRERFWELLARALYRAGRQADALATLARLRRLLADDLGIEPTPAIARLEERILVQDPTLDAAAPGAPLPAPLSSFVGRADELDELERRLEDDRLVTVLGPGGVGKTRVAVELAGRVAGSFPDGVWLVDLAPVPGPEGVVGAVAAALGIATPPGAGDAPLIDWARARRALLVLDNCEHVVTRVAELVQRLLPVAPGLRVLATSRRPLEVVGEVLVALAGLPTAEVRHGGRRWHRRRRGTAVRGARRRCPSRLHPRRVPTGGDRAVPPPGRPSPGDRARRGARRRDVAAGDRRAPRRPVPTDGAPPAAARPGVAGGVPGLEP